METKNKATNNPVATDRKKENVNTDFTQKAVIRAIGVGGGGCNAINRMVLSQVKGVDFIAINTDNQALELNAAPTRVRIGDKLTRGLGAGADPEVGAKAATESRDEISGLLRGTDLLFVTAGMGGGTGTGAAPVIAQIAQDMGILTVGVVTKPFRFEGAKRSINAEGGIEELSKYVDSLIVVPNDKLLDIADEDTTVDQAFAMADHVLRYGITGISDLVSVPGLINLDMADVKRVMTDAGICHMGIGRAQGPDRVEDAIDEAIHSPLLDSNIDGAQKIIINFTGSSMKIREVSEAASLVRDSAHPSADIIIGAVLDENLDDEIMITIIASGFDDSNEFGAEVNTESFRTIGSAVRNEDLNTDFAVDNQRDRSSARQASRDERSNLRREEYTPSYETNYEDPFPRERRNTERRSSYRDSGYNEAPYRESRRDEREDSRRNDFQTPTYDERENRSQQRRESNNRNQNSRILPWLFNEDEK
ncbi:cell division protein FtsZ [Fastidiosipila sanguinis]|uniref:Cell division protein FtsZ n=1 Tax=Fastidiosipila sanguinis TaxID=236753 RepID=A0A2S0KNU3_9FIRM|nr:cell division protein FtsZ [Fastidiosipila sanguinis]AVM42705.1 cell division protein FtsZ [Fastidiosipila sanguinis]